MTSVPEYTVRLITLFVIIFLATTTARRFDRCSLAREMERMGVPRSELPNWVCIAEHESTFNTEAVGPPNTDGSRDYGIFQINSRYWCQNQGPSSNGCRLRCSELLVDDISRAVTCARLIQRIQGWTAWSVYNPRCAGRLPNIDSCF